MSGPLTGMQLPALALPATDGRDICLASLAGRSVVAVYPWTGRPGRANPPDWDNIPGAHGSTPELEGFRDLTPQFAALGVAVFGLSGQETDHQAEMVQRLGLPFPVLSDAENRFASALALPTFATGGVDYLTRLTLVIRDGVVETVFHPVAEPAHHAGEVLDWLRWNPA